ncbi:hypothetical protein [Streptomyces fulvoviolaceus]|uniref:hypothetical protein n=1 Tax=Streptomyces fulvoviolaceus TaxID=285535 RepID=UPI000AACD221|nr:hypothetical protein [Streptomyces fulvoviolaceus]
MTKIKACALDRQGLLGQEQRNGKQTARILLAVIRLTNGTLGLVAPTLLAGRVDPEHDPSPAVVYAFRLFGIRTVLLGIDLLVLRGEPLEKALRRAVVIHSCDTVTAALLGVRGRVPARAALATTLISAVNTLLAMSAVEAAESEK